MMKSYAQLVLLIFALGAVLLAGCGAQEAEEQPTTGEEVSEAGETPILDEATNVDAVQEDLSINDVEDDYGDII